jgi:hypothetical protein
MRMKRAAKNVGGIQYEPEGSDCRATGSVSVRSGEWWSADLIVSIRREDEILLTLYRHGAPGQEDDGAGVDLRLGLADLEALPVLLNGVIAQARRDGVLTRLVGAAPKR